MYQKHRNLASRFYHIKINFFCHTGSLKNNPAHLGGVDSRIDLLLSASIISLKD